MSVLHRVLVACVCQTCQVQIASAQGEVLKLTRVSTAAPSCGPAKVRYLYFPGDHHGVLRSDQQVSIWSASYTHKPEGHANCCEAPNPTYVCRVCNYPLDGIQSCQQRHVLLHALPCFLIGMRRTLQVFCAPVLDLVNGSCAAYIQGANITNEYNRYKNSSAGTCAGCLQNCTCVDQHQDHSCFPGDAQVIDLLQLLNMLLGFLPSSALTSSA